MPKTAWELALSILDRVEKGIPLQEAVGVVARSGKPDNPDQRLSRDLANGYLRNGMRIFSILAEALPRPDKLPPKMIRALSLGIYSIISQTRVPPHAIVNNVVKIVKKEYGPGLAGVANGCLRSVLRLGDAVQEPLWYKKGALDEFGAHAVFFSIPFEIADLWRREYGEKTALALMSRSARRPWSGLRINTAKAEGRDLLSLLRNSDVEGMEQVRSAGIAFAPGCLPKEAGGRSLMDWHELGAFSFQSPGSMLIMEKLGLMNWQGPVWDVCAGFGGKSAALLENGARAPLASDTDGGRIMGMRKDLSRLGLAMDIILADGLKPPMREWHGNILLDVPCSGLGVLARRPDMRLKDMGKRLRELPDLQTRLLESAAGILAGGGELAYITCTLNPDENERLIERFLGNHPDFLIKNSWQTPHEHPWLEGMHGTVLVKH